jgi:ketosteroid isomerase-like protein
MKLLVLTSALASLVALATLAAGPLSNTQSTPKEDRVRAAVTTMLTEQQAAWNRGDVEGFMKGYWDSPELSFAGSSGVTRGWESVMARYRKSYPDQKAMGHLEFSELEVRPLGKEAALVMGRWHLKRDSDELGGVFTLVFQQFPEGWRIIHDHTSLDAKKQ